MDHSFSPMQLCRLAAFATLSALASGCSRSAATPSVSTTSPLSASVAANVPAEPAIVAAVVPPLRVRALLEERDRTPDDRAIDDAKQGAEVLAYLGVEPGMNVAELTSGGGYYTELIARSVGTNGRVFAENPPSLLAKSGLAPAWDDRLLHPPGTRIVRVDAELGVPLPLAGLDLVYAGDDLGDLGAQKVNAGATEAWGALREGGRFVVMQKAANVEARRLIERFGFRLVSEGRFLRGGGRVLLTFVKP